MIADVKPPVSNPDHEFKQGSTASVRFSIVDANGNAVEYATAILRVQQLDNNNFPIGPMLDATSAGQSNDGNLIRYSPGPDRYHYNLKTDAMAVGTWGLYVYVIDSDVSPAIEILVENEPIDGISMIIRIK
jgi:hypothetical protein